MTRSSECPSSTTLPRVACGIYRTKGPGLEVRCGSGEDDLLRSQRTGDLFTARGLADEWKAAVIAKGGFAAMA